MGLLALSNILSADSRGSRAGIRIRGRGRLFGFLTEEPLASRANILYRPRLEQGISPS